MPNSGGRTRSRCSISSARKRNGATPSWKNAARRLRDFRRQHPALAVTIESENVITQRFTSLAGELNQTEIKLLEAKARYTRAKNMYETPSLRASLLEAASAGPAGNARHGSGTHHTRNGAIAYHGADCRWGEGHPRVKLVKDLLDEQRKRLKKQQQAIVEAYVDALAPRIRGAGAQAK